MCRALAAAVSAAHDGLASLHAACDAQLPPLLRADAAVRAEALKQLDTSAFRALHATLSPLYQKAHAAACGELAERAAACAFW